MKGRCAPRGRAARRRHVLRAEEHHGGPGGQTSELQRRLGDDAERALAADEELAEIEAGVVLLERAGRLQHSPAREHDLEPEHHCRVSP